MSSTTTSNYLPVLIAATSSYPHNSNGSSVSLPSSPATTTSALPQSSDTRLYNPNHPPAQDDTSVSLLPRSQVDYLSHNWEEEDVWRSWRNMTRQKNEIANGVRLENASWRTWWKQRNGLGTVTPETLNWLKDSDVTWLYGPLHTAGDSKPPLRPLPYSSTSSSALAPPDPSTPSVGSSTSLNSSSTNGPIMAAPTKPILKHRSISQLLTSDLPTTSPIFSTSSPVYNASALPSDSDEDSDDHADATLQVQGPVKSFAGRRPSLQHTKSDSYVTKWGPDRRFRRESPPRVEPPHSASTPDVPSQTPATTSGASHAPVSSETSIPKAIPSEPCATDSGITSSTNSSDSNGQVTQSDSTRQPSNKRHHNQYGQERERKKKKHISFNTFVEQCIAIETPQPSPSSLEGLEEEDEDLDMDIDLDQGDRQVLSRSIGTNGIGRVVRIEYRDDDDDDDSQEDEEEDMQAIEEDSAMRFRLGGRGRYAMGRNPWGPTYDDGYDEDEEEGDDYEDGELGEDFSTMWGEQQELPLSNAPRQQIAPILLGSTSNGAVPDSSRPEPRSSSTLSSGRSQSMVSNTSSSSTASSSTSASTASTTSTTSSTSDYPLHFQKDRPPSSRRLSNSTTSTYRPGGYQSVYAPDLPAGRSHNSSSDSGRTSRGSRRGRSGAGSGSGSGSNTSRHLVGAGSRKSSVPPTSLRSPSVTIAPIAPTILKTGGPDAAPGGSGDFDDYFFGHQGRGWVDSFGDEGSDSDYRPWLAERKKSDDTTRSGNSTEDGTSSTPVELVYVPPPSWGAVNAQLVRRNNSREVLEDHEDGFGNAVEYDVAQRGAAGGRKKGRKIFSVGGNGNADGEVEMVEDTLLPHSQSNTVPSVVVRRTASMGDVTSPSSGAVTDHRLRRAESYSSSLGSHGMVGSGQSEERRSRSRSRSRTPSPNLISSSVQPEVSTSPPKSTLLLPPSHPSLHRSSSYSGSSSANAPAPALARSNSGSCRDNSGSGSRTRGRSTETRGRSSARNMHSSSSWSGERDGGHSSSSVGSSLSPDASGSTPRSTIDLGASAGAYSGGRGRERDREGDRRGGGSSWSYSPVSTGISPSGGSGERERGRDRMGTKRLKHSLSPDDIATRERERMGRSIDAVLPPPSPISPSPSLTSESSKLDERPSSPAYSSATSGSGSGSTVKEGSTNEGYIPQRPPMRTSESSSSTTSTASSSSAATVTLGFHTPVSSPTLLENDMMHSPSPCSPRSPNARATAPAAPVPIPAHQPQSMEQLLGSVSSSLTSSTDSNYRQDAEKQRSQNPTPSNSPVVALKMPRVVNGVSSNLRRSSESSPAQSPARSHVRTGSAHRPPLSVPAPHVAAPVESPTTSAVNVSPAAKSSSPSAAEAQAKSLKTMSPPISPSNSTSTSASTIRPHSMSLVNGSDSPSGHSNIKPATPPSIVITSRRRSLQSPPGSPTHDGLVGKAVEMVSSAGAFLGLWSREQQQQFEQRQVAAGAHGAEA